MTAAPETSNTPAGETRQALSPTSGWAPQRCECGSEMTRRNSGEMICEKTAKTYEAKYGQRLE